MKITLISPYPDICSFGIRTISSYLKQEGHKTRLIFLPDPYRKDFVAGAQRYDDHILDGIVSLCEDSDIIGVTLMTDFFDNAVQITNKVKSEIDKPIIWGGVHPTVCPDQSIQYADIVCIGEGEEAICELLNRMDRSEPYEDTNNMWFRQDSGVTKNPVRELTSNLDSYPRPDYDLEEQYLMHEGKIQSLSPELLKKSLKKSQIAKYCGLNFGYQTMTSRGCPHKCTYCANDALKNLYNGKNYLRWRTIEHLIDELLWVKEQLPYISHMWFSDDSFFARRPEEIEKFCNQYKKRIGLPFFALGSPMTITESKMSMLVDAGMILIQMGIQTGSTKMLELFNRKVMTPERTMRAIKIINKHKDKMLPLYDFLLDSPHETDEDKIESLRFISHIPKPYRIQAFSVVLFPGTQLYETAKQEEFFTNENEEVYNKRRTNFQSGYLNLLFLFASKGMCSGPFLRFCVSRPMVFVFNSKIMRPVIILTEKLIMLKRNLSK